MARRLSPLVFVLCFCVWFLSLAEGSRQRSLARPRQKREWIVPPQVLEENVDYTKKEFIARIRSDRDDENLNLVRYSLRGIGADRQPVHLFVVDPDTGYVRITGLLDREQISEFNLSGVATFKNGTVAENDILLRIKVKDQNDNAPIFPAVIAPGSVKELSAAGTSVMRIVATDADEPDNLNSKLRYDIIDQKPAGKRMFKITPDGEVQVNDASLDRETVNMYTLTVRASDMDGLPGCQTGTATINIKIADVNDNVPTLEQEAYDGSIEENTENMEVMRIKANDLDEEGTENWQTKFDIVSGNEGKHFSIYTDPKTNEGVLMLNKAVDYEEVKDLKLGITVNNVAPYHPSVTGGGSTIGVGFGSGGGGGAGGAGGGGGGSGGGGGAGGGGGSGGGTGGGSGSTWSGGSPGVPGSPGSPGSAGGKVYGVNIKVKNQPEGPRFSPKVKAIPISEGDSMVDITKVIGKYPAVDGDTGLPADNVRYVKGLDPDNWLSIDEKTSEIRLNKRPDRESPYLVNGTYTAKILCITQDMPSKTATGTIAIQVEDFNDHCPTLISQTQSMCTVQQAVYVTAEDQDAPPNGVPFTFTIVPKGTKGQWSVEHLNDTTAILRTQDTLWPGPYEVVVEVRDQQGLSCPDPQVVKLEACTCDKHGTCLNRSQQKSSVLGGAGIGLLLLGLLMLLLIPLLLLLCQCGAAGLGAGFADIPYDTKEHLISYNTEGQGEDRDMSVPLKPIEVDGVGMYPNNFGTGVAGGIAGGVAGGIAGGIASGIAGGTAGANGGHWNREMDTIISGGDHWYGWKDKAAWGDSGMALPDEFLHQYYSRKIQQGDATSKDTLLVYDTEGRGSPAGSIGCCSNLESGNDLEFLNDLGPKFTTLAEICGGTKLTTTAAETVSVPPPPKPVAPKISEKVSMESNIFNKVNMPPQPAPSVSMQTRRDESVVVKSNKTTVMPEVRPTQTLIDVKQAQTLIDVQPAQTLMVQQQPLYYVVEPQVSNTVLLAERPTVGLGQGMYVLNGAPISERVLVQGGVPAQTAVSGGERVMLLETGGGSSQALNAGLLQSANLSGSQLLLVDRSAQGGQVLQGALTGGVGIGGGGLSGSQGMLFMEGQGGPMIHGSLQRGVTTAGGSQNMMFVERQIGPAGVVHGSLQRGMTTTTTSSSGPTVLQSGTLGLNESSVKMSGLPSSHKVVVQEKKTVKTTNSVL